jgi:oligogalacturonide lyase
MITENSRLTLRRQAVLAALSFSAAAAAFAQAAPPPKSWIDPETGHRVIRITDEPGSGAFYFNVNAYTPDGKEMVYSCPDGIRVLNLSTFETRPLLARPARTVVVAHKTPTLFYLVPTGETLSALWSVNIDTGEKRKIADLPPRASIVTINADDTLGAGTFIEGDATSAGIYGAKTHTADRMGPLNGGVPVNKGEMMAERLAARLPMTMFTLDLQTGKTAVSWSTARTGSITCSSLPSIRTS